MSSREEQEAHAIELFQKIGLAESTAKNVAKNQKSRTGLLECIQDAGAAEGCSRAQGNLIYAVATKFPANALVHRRAVLDLIMSDKVSTAAQLEAAHEYLARVGPESLDLTALSEAAGVGVVISPEELTSGVALLLEDVKAKLIEERYRFSVGILLANARKTKLRFADGVALKAEVDAQVEALLGPKTEEDTAPVKKVKKAPAPAAAAAKDVAEEAAEAGEDAAAPADVWAHLPKPAENNYVHTQINFSDGHVMRVANTKEQLEAHLKATGGKVMTRFPPEPNGYLHIGHAKAMFIDFGMASQYGGSCYLRFDDTNPEAEKQEYIDHIQDIVGWMGWTPFTITHAADYFEELHRLAVKLIEKGYAYVDHQTSEEIKEYREKRMPSPWRDRPIEENLRLFEDMRRGLVEEGKATLRMKMDVKNENYNMFDLVAYRIKFTPHPHAGDKWCIYPSYDYTHCINDSLENITHSMCTLEFEPRRASYYWLLEVLELYKPCVWEYSRMNITNTVLSKRKLQKLVKDQFVRAWDDPRLLTLAGLRRRGATPAGINSFCRELGVTRNESGVPMHRLEFHIRTDLEKIAPRRMAVLDPLRVVITNMPADKVEHVECRHFPGRAGDESTYTVPFSRVCYIERADFRETDEKGYFGMAPGKECMLRYAYPVTCTGVRKGADGRVEEVTCEYHPDWKAQGMKPPKGVLHWVAQPAPGVEPPKLEARLYDVLFKSEDVNALGDAWLNDLNPESEVVTWGFASKVLAEAAVGDKFQLERLGYFAVDPDSPKVGHLVLNRTVTLKDSRR